jgi:NADP-dependent aldehyde dehydrogenase
MTTPHDLIGKSFIGRTASASSSTAAFHAVDPATSERLEPAFHDAAPEDVDRAAGLAAAAFPAYRAKSAEERAGFLERAADAILGLGDALIARARAESGLPEPRLVSERGRTLSQLRMFAGVVREGSWVGARIDRADPARKPIPKPDLRRLLVPIGPAAVFGASNFPLAFSVAGGDTASALAAGCPVIVKAHPAHPGTSELVFRALIEAAGVTGMPDGVVSLVHGSGNDVGLRLVRHPLVKAVGFTGSLRGGRALFDAAAARPEPIPVYAEMGSANPVFVLPGALAERADAIAEGLHQSVTLGVGQFCTNPGLVIGLAGDGLERLLGRLADLIRSTPPGTMLHEGIRQGYERGAGRLGAAEGVTAVARASAAPEVRRTEAAAAVFSTKARTFLGTPELEEEVFGPSTLVVHCGAPEELEEVALRLHGHLTATIHGTPEDLKEHRRLVSILETKVGRLLFNGYPTGVEVCHATQHGGPYPATTDQRTTSVETAAIERFARPICYQNWPDEALPPELRSRNERGIWRLVDGELTRGDC